MRLKTQAMRLCSCAMGAANRAGSDIPTPPLSTKSAGLEDAAARSVRSLCACTASWKCLWPADISSLACLGYSQGVAVFAAGVAAYSDDEDGGEGEEFVAAAAVDVQVGVEEAVLVEKDDRQAVMPEEPVKIVALGVAFVVPPSRRSRGSFCPACSLR